MSQENVELMREVFAAFNRRDLDGVLALMDDDVEANSRLAPIEGGYRGTRGSAAGGRTYSTSFPTSPSRLQRCATLGR
jgi:ketosteroid isomerase-like protein